MVEVTHLEVAFLAEFPVEDSQVAVESLVEDSPVAVESLVEDSQVAVESLTEDSPVEAAVDLVEDLEVPLVGVVMERSCMWMDPALFL